MKNPLFEYAHPFTKILFLFFIILGSFFIFLSVGIITAIPVFNIHLSSLQESLNINDPDNIGFIKYMQFIQHLGIFVVPPIIAAYIFSKNPKKYLHTDTKSRINLFILAVVIILSAIPFIQYTGALNAKLTLPSGFSVLETQIRNMEDSAAKMTDAFLNVTTVGGLIINLILVAILPAIGEEFLFRGILMKLFKEWTKNIHLAIFISAFLFSAFHFQFFGFLPRFLLGILFGYLFVWSKNIWVPVSVHFINNGLAVFVYYFLHDTDLYEKADNIGTESFTTPSVLFSILFTGMFLFLFYKQSKIDRPKLDFE